MKKQTCFLLLFLNVWIYPVSGQERNITYQRQDSIIFTRYIQAFTAKKNLPTSDLIIKTAEFFIKAPYVAGTLNVNGKKEMLVVNLRQFDGNTLVESCLALVRTLQHQQPTFKAYSAELKDIRYRNGKLTDYNSRLHYFSDWIPDNEKKGKIINLTYEFGGEPFSIIADDISRKAKLHQPLSDTMIRHKTAETEQNIPAGKYFRIPKNIPANSRIRNGDILCLTTNGKGAGISQIGFALRQGQILYFIHASQAGKKVEISSVPFIQFIEQNEKTTGYMVIRPL